MLINETLSTFFGKTVEPYCEDLFMLYANSTCADQTEHPQPNQTIAVHCLDRMCTGFIQTNLCKIPALFKYLQLPSL